MPLTLRQENGITTIAINRPEARNAVDPETATALYNAFLDFEANETAQIAILTGSSTAFCAGFDLKAAAAGLDFAWHQRHDIPDGWSNPQQHPLPSPMGPARLMLSKPVIAAIEGAAVAGGMELALWCDIRLMGQSAYFGVFCRRWGVPLIDGGTQRLPALIGQGRANELILTGRAVPADEALAIGLTNRVVQDGTALAAAQTYAEALLKFPQDCMLADRDAARPAPAELAAGLTREWRGATAALAQTTQGAARFARGKGRGGGFDDI